MPNTAAQPNNWNAPTHRIGLVQWNTSIPPLAKLNPTLTAPTFFLRWYDQTGATGFGKFFGATRSWFEGLSSNGTVTVSAP